jgi:hypothetical protein
MSEETIRLDDTLVGRLGVVVFEFDELVSELEAAGHRPEGPDRVRTRFVDGRPGTGFTEEQANPAIKSA